MIQFGNIIVHFFCPRSTWCTYTNPTNSSAAKIKDTTLTDKSSNIRDSLYFFLSFEDSLLRNSCRYNRKRDSLGKLRVVFFPRSIGFTANNQTNRSVSKIEYATLT